MIFATTVLGERARYSQVRLASGSIVVTLDTGAPYHSTLHFEDAAACEAFYDFLGTVVAGLRFDALEEARKAGASGLERTIAGLGESR